MEANILRGNLISRSKTDKLNILKYLKDQFDSFNKNIEYFDEMLNVLLEFSMNETNREVKIEILEAISKAAVFQNITNNNFDKFLELLFTA